MQISSERAKLMTETARQQIRKTFMSALPEKIEERAKRGLDYIRFNLSEEEYDALDGDPFEEEGFEVDFDIEENTDGTRKWTLTLSWEAE